MKLIQIRTTPDRVNDLAENEVFVFGSNLGGMHGAGAARTARERFGAVMGNGIGPQGQCYALPTKDQYLCTLKPSVIQTHVEVFLNWARQNPKKTFLITPVGCGLAGLAASIIAPMFANVPENCVLPAAFQHPLHWPYLHFSHNQPSGMICQLLPDKKDGYSNEIHRIDHSPADPLKPPYLLPEDKVRATFTMYGETYQAVPFPEPVVPDGLVPDVPVATP